MPLKCGSKLMGSLLGGDSNDMKAYCLDKLLVSEFYKSQSSQFNLKTPYYLSK